MAHPEQREFFERLKFKWPEWFTGVSVLEVGSLDINGSVRDFFDATRYVGVDLEAGPGVDLIGRGESLQFLSREFDVAVSAECFEHNPNWSDTFFNMCRIASKVVIFTCATTGRPEHGTSKAHPGASPFTPGDYYRNLVEADFDQRRMPLGLWFSEYGFAVNESSCDLYFWGLLWP